MAGEGRLGVLAQSLLHDQQRPDAAALAAVFDVRAAAMQADTRVAAALTDSRRQWAQLVDHPHW